MTISASDEAGFSGKLERALELYRDLSVVLRGQIAQLEAARGDELQGRSADEVIRFYSRFMRVADAEASLVTRTKAGSGGLDLAAARAEVVARLAVRAAAG
jgi:hypothetical protein